METRDKVESEFAKYQAYWISGNLINRILNIQRDRTFNTGIVLKLGMKYHCLISGLQDIRPDNWKRNIQFTF